MKKAHRLIAIAFSLASFHLFTADVHAQFTFTTNNGAITITRYTGPGGDVTIPSTINGYPVTAIGYAAFGDCLTMTSVTVPNSVTTIADLAFQDTSLASVTIPSSVTQIGFGVFNECGSLTAITVDPANASYSSADGVLFDRNQVTLIQYPSGRPGPYAVPVSVTRIVDVAFEKTSVTSLTIPNSVTSITDGSLRYCSRLTAIIVDPSNPSYSSADGVLFDRNQMTLLQYPGGKGGAYAVPNGVTTIGSLAFSDCHLSSVTIPGSVVTIGSTAFLTCYSLTNVAIGSGVMSIGSGAFFLCTALRGVYFQGNAPSLGGSDVFYRDDSAVVYYLPGTTGWGATYGGRPTALYGVPPAIQNSPQTQTAEAGSVVNLRAKSSGSLPLFYFWYCEGTNFLSCSTSCHLELTNVDFSRAGTYTVVVSNALGVVTGSPAVLSVIAPVERRPVRSIKVTGQAGNVINLDYADFLRPAPNWTALGSVSLASTSQYCFDVSLPLPPQRFFRAWQTGAPGVIPSLDLHIVPAITLTGSLSDSVRVDAINQFGPTDAWFTLDTVILTNTPQLYFDTSAWAQPPRLYRVTQVP